MRLRQKPLRAGEETVLVSYVYPPVAWPVRVSSRIPTDESFPSDQAASEALAAEKAVLLELIAGQADEVTP